MKSYRLTGLLCLLALSNLNIPNMVYARELVDLSIEQLMNVEISVSLVSRTAVAISKNPASVYVLTSEDIRRSGMSSIPELLRLVPGLDVARISSSKWAINARGSNQRFAREFVVMIDGKSLYSTSFSSVEWDAIDTIISDIERIEVVRGPGGTTWGSNAVNGIINIVTKDAHKTIGDKLGLFVSSADNKSLEYRHGGNIGENGAYRFYLRSSMGMPFREFDTSRAEDQNKKLNSGFRFDWKHSKDIDLRVVGNAYRNSQQEKIVYKGLGTIGKVLKEIDVNSTNIYGVSLLFCLNRKLSNVSDYQLKLYYDRSGRNEASETSSSKTIDFDFQHRFRLGARNEVVYGIGYNSINNSFVIKNRDRGFMALDKVTNNTKSFFIQDKICLKPDKLFLTLGTKIYKQSYINTKNDPSARLIWMPKDKHTFWTAFSQGHRIPSRVEVSGNFPAHMDYNSVTKKNMQFWLTSRNNLGLDALEAEYMKAQEFGYRYIPNSKFSCDVTCYMQSYSNLLTIEPFGIPAPVSLTSLIQKVVIQNNGRARYRGVEVASKWQATENWTLSVGYTASWAKIYQTNGIRSKSPERRWFVNSALDLKNGLEADLFLARTSAYFFYSPFGKDLYIDSHVRLDCRFGWKLNHKLEVSIGGQDLLSEWHREIGQSFTEIPSEIPRSFYLKADLSF